MQELSKRLSPDRTCYLCSWGIDKTNAKQGYVCLSTGIFCLKKPKEECDIYSREQEFKKNIPKYN